MKSTKVVLWTIAVSVLMFISSFQIAECRPSSSSRRTLQSAAADGGPGPPPKSKSHRNCPYLEGPSAWPSHLSANADVYHPDLTSKVWDSQLVIEGTARSRSEVRKDGSFGVTFDVHRIVKGDAPLLRQRNKQFRLQFLDNPPNSNSGPGSGPSPSPNPPSGQRPPPALESSPGIGRSGKKSIPVLTIGQHSDNSVTKCAPPKATIKTGRKYFVFASKLDSHLVPVFSPELVNKKNAKALESILCEGCGQAPGVAAPKEMLLELKERLRVRCRLRVGNPVPTLTWYKDGQLVNFGDSRYRLRAKRRQSILVIRRAKESDAGLYMCEAKNGFGSATASTRVLLPRTPVPTTLSSPNNSSRKSVGTTPTTLWPVRSIKCPFDSFCLNGGTCSYYEAIQEYVCQCAEGYKGQRCDTKDIPTSGKQGADFETTSMVLFVWS